jgi:hypothetical protein
MGRPTITRQPRHPGAGVHGRPRPPETPQPPERPPDPKR